MTTFTSNRAHPPFQQQQPGSTAPPMDTTQQHYNSYVTPSPPSARTQHSASISPNSHLSTPQTPATAQQTYNEHLAELGKRSRLHSQHGGYKINPRGALTSHEMLAAQQHFGFSPQQQAQQLQQQQQLQQLQQHADNGAWHDEQEQFLRDLLSTPLDGSPNSLSGGSYVSQSPPYAQQSGSVSGDEAARYSSLSPGSSSGLHSLHEMIHGTNGSSSNNSSAGGSAVPGFSEADERARAVQIKQEHEISHQFGLNGSDLSMMDPGALDFFVKSMTNQAAAAQMPMMPNHMNGISQTPMDIKMFEQQQQQHMIQQQQQQHQQQQQQQQQSFAPNDQQFHFQHPNRMSAPFPGMYDQLQQQHAQQQVLESRKRSAPTTMTNGSDQPQGNLPRSTSGTIKRPRKSSAEKAAPQQVSQPAKNEQPLAPRPADAFAQSAAASFLPRMEVGSNATALAAIERLKAKKRAAAEQAIQQQAMNMEAASKGGKGSFTQLGQASVTPAMKHEKKVAHNAIERRYRNNINARISALRNAVPALRELRPKRPTRKGKEAPPEDLVDGVPAATKLNKATILGKATEYIRYLKGRETRLVSEVAGLRELIRSLEGGEELLDLWQGEMERVVAEQEAIAKAAFALEDENFDMGDDEDDEDEDEDEEKPSRSPSQTSSSRYMMGLFMGFSVLGGGAEVFSGNDSATTSSAAEHAHHVLRASSGRVIGASHQLLKRGMQATNVKIGNMANDPHHFDHVANHLLVVEVLRGVALVACLAFIFWPAIARFLPGFVADGKHGRRRSRPERKSRREDDLLIALERKKLLATLADSTSSPFQTDRAMRSFVGAPQSAFGGAFGLVALAARQSAYRIGVATRDRSTHEDERAAIWCRLLELETSMGPLAQRSLLARLHTLLTVISLPSIGYAASSPASSSPLLHPARVFGTIAVAMVRASSGNNIVSMLFAERYWTLARRCRLLASDEGVSDDSVTEATDRWLDPVLDMSLADAIALCPAPVSVASAFMPHSDAAARATMVSPLLCIAASQHSRQLSSIWTTLLCQIVRTTCPLVNDYDEQGSAPTCAEFVKHHADAKIELPLLSDTTDRDHMTGQITRLTLTAPRCPRLQIVSNVTFGTWALLLGNMSVARSVAIALLRTAQLQQQKQEAIVVPASATAFVSFVLGDEAGERLSSFGSSASSSDGKGAALTEVDALAAASLSWLSFLRTLSVHMAAGEQDSSDKNDVSALARQAVTIRRLLATARAVRPVASEEMLAELAAAATLSSEHAKRRDEHRDSLASTASSSPSLAHVDEVSPSSASASPSSPSRIAQQSLDESLDLLTDILAVLGRKAATGCAFTKETLLQDEENIDSGVEWVA